MYARIPNPVRETNLLTFVLRPHVNITQICPPGAIPGELIGQF